MVGGKELEPGAGCLRDDKAVEEVMPDQFGKLADRLGVLGGDAEQFHALPRKLLAEVVRHGQLADRAEMGPVRRRRPTEGYSPGVSELAKSRRTAKWLSTSDSPAPIVL